MVRQDGYFPFVSSRPFLSSSILFSALEGGLMRTLLRMPLLCGFPWGLANGEAGKENKQGGRVRSEIYSPTSLFEKVLEARLCLLSIVIFRLKDTLLPTFHHSLDPATAGLG